MRRRVKIRKDAFVVKTFLKSQYAFTNFIRISVTKEKVKVISRILSIEEGMVVAGNSSWGKQLFRKADKM